MSFELLTKKSPWAKYSRKLSEKICSASCVGTFLADQSIERGMHLAIGKEGSIVEGALLEFYWLVDPDDGIIVDAKFKAHGESALIGAAQVICELVIGKNYNQAKRISAELIDLQVRDKPAQDAFPAESALNLNIAIDAIEKAANTCQHIPLDINYSTPSPTDFKEIEKGQYPGWELLDKASQLKVLEECLDKDIRPYIELDAGGVKILNLENNTLLIAYEGSCTSCISATGSTLSYIQHVIRSKIDPNLSVIPDLSHHE